MSVPTILLIVISQAWGAEPAALTLREACREAAANNGGVVAGRLEASAAGEREKQARASFLPKLGVSTGLTSTDRPDVGIGLLADQNELLPTSLTDRPDVDNYRTQVGLDYVLYDGGRRSRMAKAASHERRARDHEAERVRSTVLTQVAEVFYAALCADYQVEIAKEEAGRMKERLALARKLKAEGRGTDADVSAAEYRLENARRRLLEARNAVEDSREELGILLGRRGPVREHLDEGTENPLGPAEGLRAAGRAEEAAARTSPRLSALRENAAMHRESERARRSAWIPTVTLSARYGYDSEDVFDFDSDRDSYVVGLVVSWNAFDGGARGARIREAADTTAAWAALLREGEERVRRLARRAVRAVAEADAANETARKKVASCLAVYRVSVKAREAGRESFKDLLEAQSDLAEARLEEARAYCVTRSARARLLEVTGSW